jgi:hypothetical protein
MDALLARVQAKSVNNETQNRSRPSKAASILIPVAARSTPLLSAAQISTRLTKIFEYKGFKVFGDLHECRLSEFATLRNCGKQTILELERLVREVEGEIISPAAFNRPSPPKPLFIAGCARRLKLKDLPLSARAENVLKRLGIKRLGDLNGMTVKDLLDTWHCRDKSVQEIESVIQSANDGRFTASPKKLRTLNLSDLLLMIDDLLGQLSRRDFLCIAQRLRRNRKSTLQAIADRFGLCQEMVRQIILRGLRKLARRGGLIMKALIDRIARRCREERRPLTAALLRKWLPKPWKFRCDAEFYVEIIATLRPDVPTLHSNIGLARKKKR